MKVYLVGGSVRDRLLGYPHDEKDWVVIGATPEEMIQLGYRPVGKDFPVFLHPQTHEEYALARTERKTGKGYTQFVFHAAPDVTLEEDLKRRDLTINAMAMTDDGKIIDPFDGQTDLKNKLLRHVSEAFVEDPVRILRVGRFLAKFAPLGFHVAPETLNLMQKMVENGEVDALVPDRVWQEMDRALGEKNPEKFFEVLDECGALVKLFHDLYIPESFKQANNAVRFAQLFLDSAQDDIRKFCQRYPVPVYYRDMAILANQYQTKFMSDTLTPEITVDLLERLDAYRRPERFDDLLAILIELPQAAYIKMAWEVTQDVDIYSLQSEGYEGKDLGEAIHKARVEKIRQLKRGVERDV